MTTAIMKSFLDTANLGEIGRGAWSGIFDGVRANPTLVSRKKKTFRELMVEAAKVRAPIGTRPYQVSEMLFPHPLPDRGLELFTGDREKARAKPGEIAEPAGTHKGAR